MKKTPLQSVLVNHFFIEKLYMDRVTFLFLRATFVVEYLSAHLCDFLAGVLLDSVVYPKRDEAQKMNARYLVAVQLLHPTDFLSFGIIAHRAFFSYGP